MVESIPSHTEFSKMTPLGLTTQVFDDLVQRPGGMVVCSNQTDLAMC